MYFKNNISKSIWLGVHVLFPLYYKRKQLFENIKKLTVDKLKIKIVPELNVIEPTRPWVPKEILDTYLHSPSI